MKVTHSNRISFYSDQVANISYIAKKAFDTVSKLADFRTKININTAITR